MATENNDLPVRAYQKQFIGLMQTVFGVQSTFTPTFGALQALDGIQNNAIAFSVKANDVPVAVGAYNPNPNVAFGTGTSNSNRFGPMQEIIYSDIDVPYSFGWSFNEGIDQLTVNSDLDSAVADRLNLQAQAKTRLFNSQLGAYLVASAAADLGAVDDVNKVFEKASERYTDLEVVAPVRAYVTAEVYNAIIDHALVTSAKGSAVNIDENGIVRFRDIIVTKTPARYMAGKSIVFAPDNVGRAFTGINVVRTIQSENFAGVALQGAGKAGQWISDDNRQAIFTAGTSTTTTTTKAKPITTTTTTAHK
ncbi:phage capsid protein [Lacticaseibacillus paracasei]|uniref:phage capsid protein n=1 Tax=Lacticaseibacillus paracasei TaxID=1597 RepID=UPI001C1E7854|nr:phage capsid protein [Lacticaseibacillus paracasei]MBU6046308.1 phage capsid protein [Lacticaseibacillus paracasei]MCL4971167.1 phage capsid protein [Lacticaseibacillus paracasei]